MASTIVRREVLSKETIAEKSEWVGGRLAGASKGAPDSLGAGNTLLGSTDRLSREISERIIAPVIEWQAADVNTSFIPLNRWEGSVIELHEDEGTFLARIEDRTADSPPEIAELPLDDVDESDRKLLGEGAVFYWTVGYRIDEHGGRARTSTLRFQRLPGWSAEEIEASRERAKGLSKFIEWN